MLRLQLPLSLASLDEDRSPVPDPCQFTVCLSVLFHHEVSVRVRPFTSPLGHDQQRHDAWCPRMCVSWLWSLGFWGPSYRAPETYRIYTSTDLLLFSHRVLLLHWFPAGGNWKVPDSLDERLRFVQTKSLKNWHYIYMADTEWSPILIDSCLFAKSYDVENVPLKKENLLTGL